MLRCVMLKVSTGENNGPQILQMRLQNNFWEGRVDPTNFMSRAILLYDELQWTLAS